MIHSLHKKQSSIAYKILCSFIALTFSSSVILPPTPVFAQTVLNLPVPGTMLPPSAGFAPALMTGITIHPDNPLRFDFIMDRGQSGLAGEPLKEEYEKMIKYFMASLTVPEDELWVNLSPYEKDRMVPQGLGDTEMGRDMLAQDYLLKQLTASLMYPEEELGKEFWNKVYKEAHEKFGTTEIPVNTFNKVWIVPDEALVYEQGTSAFVIKSRLAVMLEQDYVASQHNLAETPASLFPEGKQQGLEEDIIREIIIPAIEQEINEGENFANLRQIYNALILATWYKQRLKDSLLGKVYVDQNKTRGIDTQDKGINQKIYDQYIESFKKGVYNFIKEDYDPATQQVIPRKYFSGGMAWKPGGLKTVGALALGTLLSFGSPDFGDASALAAAAMGGNKDGVTTEFVDNAKPGDIGTAIVVKEGVQPILLAQAASLSMEEQGQGSRAKEQGVASEFADNANQGDKDKGDLQEVQEVLVAGKDVKAIVEDYGDALIERQVTEDGSVRVILARRSSDETIKPHLDPYFASINYSFRPGISNIERFKMFIKIKANRDGARIYLRNLYGMKIVRYRSTGMKTVGTIKLQKEYSTIVVDFKEKKAWIILSNGESAELQTESARQEESSGYNGFTVEFGNKWEENLSANELTDRFEIDRVWFERKPGVTGEKKSGEWNTIDIKKAYQWIKSQIHPKTGLVKSFPTVPEQDASYGVTWMYNQAQSIQDALAVGDLAMAEQLARSTLKLKRNKGAWYNGYITDSGEVATLIKEQGVSWTGPNMALGHGLLNVLERTTDQKLAEEIIKATFDLARWLEGYSFDREKYAYVSVGEGSGEVWTEHNERVFAFYYQLYNQFNNLRHKNKIVLEKYKNNANVQGFKLRADKIIRWIQTDKKEGGMWAGDHYLVGYKDVEGKELIPEIITSLPGDHPDYGNRHAWGYPQYLGPIMASIAGLNPKDFAGGMDWLLAHLSQIEINGKMFKGVPRWLGTPSIWAKGTSETLVALQLLRRENEVKMLLPTLAALQTENGGILAAVGDPGYGWPIHFPYESYEGISGVLVGVGQLGPEFIADLELVKPPSLNFPDATVRLEGAPVDPAGVKFEGDVYIYNHAGQPIKLSEQAGQFFPRTPDGRPFIEDTRILIVNEKDAATAGTSSPIMHEGGFARSLVFTVVLGVLTCVSGCGQVTPVVVSPPIWEEATTDVAKMSPEQLVIIVRDETAYWPNRREAAQRLFALGDEEGMDTVRAALVWPSIAALNVAEFTYDAQTNYRRLQALGWDVVGESLVENLQNPGADTNTRKWSALLIGQLAPFGRGFPVLAAVFENKEHIYEWWHDAEARTGLQRLFERQDVNTVVGYFIYAANADGKVNEKVRLAALRAAAHIPLEGTAIEVSDENQDGSTQDDFDRFIDQLIEFTLYDNNSEIRRAIAAEGLGKMGDAGQQRQIKDRALAPLTDTLLNDTNSQVRESAAYALGELGSKLAIPMLEVARDYDQDADVREAAGEAINKIDSASSPVVEQEGQGARVKEQGITSDEIRDTSDSFTKGGIDLNPALLNLQIRRDGNGVPLPLPMQPIENMHIDGFLPVIINITPIANLPLLLGLADTKQDADEITPAMKAREPEEVSYLN